MVTKIIGGRIDSVGIGRYSEEAGYQVLDSDLNMTAEQTWTTGSGWVDVRGAKQFHIIVKGTGADTSSSGTVTFEFVAHPTGVTSTIPEPNTADMTIALSISDTSQKVKGTIVEAPYGYIKLIKITNSDATYGVNAVNAYVYYKLER